MPELNELIDNFLNQIEANSSINTFKAYKSDLKYLEQQLNSLSKLTENNLRELRLNLIEKYSKKTVARRWSAWREFFRFCQLSGYLNQNPIVDLEIEAPNRLRQVKQRVKSELLELICNYSSNVCDKALLWFMYSTGVRPSELFKYGIFENLNLAAREFYLPDRVTFLSEQAFESLSQYLHIRQTPTLSEPIFVNDEGKPLKEMFVYTIFTQIAEKLGVQATLLDLRDSLMLRLFESGASPDELKYFLGFKSIKSIEPILRLSFKEKEIKL